MLIRGQSAIEPECDKDAGLPFFLGGRVLDGDEAEKKVGFWFVWFGFFFDAL